MTLTLLPAALVLTTAACGDDDDDDTTSAGGTSAGGTSAGGTSAGTSNGGTNSGGTSNAGQGGSLAGTAGTASGTSGSGGNAGSAGATQAQSDAQLAGILSVINSTEVTQGKLAATKGLRADVVDYGSMMDSMHTANQTKLLQLLQGKSLSPDENSAEVQMLKAKGDPATAKLTSDPAKSMTFDDDYIQIQIDGHTDALNMLDTVLLPKVQDAELKAHFTTTRGDVVTHLDHANMLKSGGAGGASGASGAAGMAGMSAGGSAGAGAGGSSGASGQGGSL